MADDADQGPNPNPPAPRRVLSDAFKNRIREESHSQGKIFDETSLVFVMEKKLSSNDVKPALHRLLILPPENRFLNDDEDARLRKNGQAVIATLVTIIEPSLEKGEVGLAKWKTSRDKLSYVLSIYWNEIVERNNLTMDQIVQLWAFRVGGELWLALVRPTVN